MEEKIKDVYENIKERLSNPLIFSFIVSWLICNWKITVALIRYDKSQIKAEDCKSIFEFIQLKIDNRWDSFYFPLILAFAYTLGFPYLRQGIRILNNKAIKWGDKNEAKFVLEGMTKEHIELKKNYDITLKKVADKTDIIDKLYDLKTISGYWTRIKRIENQVKTEEIRISDRDIYLVEKFNNSPKESEITTFVYDRDNGKVFFVSQNIEKKSAFDGGSISTMSYDVNVLYIKDNGDMSGKENFNDIEYVRHKIKRPDNSDLQYEQTK